MLDRRAFFLTMPGACLSLKAGASTLPPAPLPRLLYRPGKSGHINPLGRIWDVSKDYFSALSGPIGEREAIEAMYEIVERVAGIRPPFVMRRPDGFEPIVFRGVAYSPNFLVAVRLNLAHERLPTYHLEWTDEGVRDIIGHEPHSRFEYMPFGPRPDRIVLEGAPCL